VIFEEYQVVVEKYVVMDLFYVYSQPEMVMGDAFVVMAWTVDEDYLIDHYHVLSQSVAL
jgi:hypothetical protein